MPRKGSPYGPAYEATRRRFKGKPCAMRLVCEGAPSTSADHVPPLSRHRHVEGSGCCSLQPACAACQDRQRVDLANETRRGAAVVADDLLELVEPEGADINELCWRVPWLADLLELMPPEAVWPRYMTLPHPRAVGSHGGEFEAWVERRGGKLRWWQSLVSRRLLEYDADGRLVWDTLILSLARQLGKSWWLRELLFWRIHQGPRFGGQQGALHIARTLTPARKEFVKVARQLSERGDEYAVIVTKTQEEIRWLGDDSAWIVRTVDGAYGETAGLVVVDEAWDVKDEDVDEGIDPTRVAVEQSQLALVSTAHRRARMLMRRRRAAAIEAIVAREVPDDDELLIEWSTPRLFALDNPAGWRMASPHWTLQRERLIRKNLRRVLAGGTSEDPDEPDPVEALRAQWLNQWPTSVVRKGQGEPLIDQDAWSALRAGEDEPLELWVAVADNFGHGAGVAAVARIDDGRYEVDAWTCRDRDVALAQARATLGQFPVSGALIADGSLNPSAADAEGSKDGALRFGLSLIRQMVKSGRVVRDSATSTELDQQLADARVRPSQAAGGLSLVSQDRSDLVRAMALALRAAEVDRPAPGVI